MFGQALLGEPTSSIQSAGIFTFKITTVNMGAPYASVPIYLANNQRLRSPVFIDWGDGQQTVLLPSSKKPIQFTNMRQQANIRLIAAANIGPRFICGVRTKETNPKTQLTSAAYFL